MISAKYCPDLAQQPKKERKMETSKHQWATFQKGRMRIKACVSCGELHLPSNSEKICQAKSLIDSQIVKAGYRLYGEARWSKVSHSLPI